MTNVTIIKGAVRSGKTTRLARWVERHQDVAGVLSPDGPYGRIFLDLANGETMAMENPLPQDAVIPVGRFRFRKAAFEWANARLIEAARDSRSATLVIDEVGPLELQGGGLRPGVLAALGRSSGRVVLVVREHLVDAVVSGFGIPHAKVEIG